MVNQTLISKECGILRKIAEILFLPFEIADSCSQEDYFNELNGMINKAHDNIVMMGYDEPFMSYNPTKQVFEKVIKKCKVNINAIFPEGIETCLSDFEKYQKLNIFWHKKLLNRGFIVVDEVHTAAWDSTKKTRYLPEMNQGVYFRGLRYYGVDLAQAGLDNFKKLCYELKKSK